MKQFNTPINNATTISDKCTNITKIFPSLRAYRYTLRTDKWLCVSHELKFWTTNINGAFVAFSSIRSQTVSRLNTRKLKVKEQKIQIKQPIEIVQNKWLKISRNHYCVLKFINHRFRCEFWRKKQFNCFSSFSKQQFHTRQ